MLFFLLPNKWTNNKIEYRIYCSPGKKGMLGVANIIIIQETYLFCCKDPGMKSTHLVDNPLHVCMLVWLSFSSAGSL